MKKIAVFSIILVLTLALFASCGSIQLAESFDETAVADKAQQTVQLLTDGEYAQVVELLRDDLKVLLPEDEMKTTFDEVFAKLGEFESFDSYAVLGQQDKEKNNFAIIVYSVNYEKAQAKYTITFDEDMNIVGLYIK